MKAGPKPITNRAALGSISGSSAPRADNRPNMRGPLTVERIWRQERSGG
jgi:hypothetical protein